jgi:hypothetical protein
MSLLSLYYLYICEDEERERKMFVTISPPGAHVYASRVDWTGCLGLGVSLPLNDKIYK